MDDLDLNGVKFESLYQNVRPNAYYYTESQK